MKNRNSGNERIYGLDILRATAILTVLISHGRRILPQSLEPLHDVLNFDGVTMFFVLSGFLIGRILIKSGEKQKQDLNLIHFWKRRWFRTIPNYLLILLLLFFLHGTFGNLNVWDYQKFLFFSQNLFSPHPSFFPEAWSLSVEEWFYIAFPVMFFVLLKSNFKVRKSVLLTCVLFIATAMLHRIFQYGHVDINNLNTLELHFRKIVVSRLDSVAWGVVGAVGSVYYPLVWNKYRKGLFYAGLVIFFVTKVLYLTNTIVFQSFMYAVLKDSFEAIATLFLLPLLCTIKTGTGIIYRTITFISLISYSLYLLHYSVVQKWIIDLIDWGILFQNPEMAIILNYILYWVLSIFFSYILFNFFEKPMTSLRDFKLSNARLRLGNRAIEK